MCSSESLREFVTERLTAAAEEIFRVFEKTIVEYEEEIDRQRRLLDLVWKPEIKLHRIELPQQHVCKEEEEEVLTEQQPQNQERNSSLDQEDPDPPQIKEEQEELCTSQEGEQLVLKQETDNVMLIPAYEESDHREPEPISEYQLLSHSSPVAENQVQKESEHIDLGSTENSEKRHLKNTGHSDGVDYALMSELYPFVCKTCGKRFRKNSKLKYHTQIHTGEKPFPCNTCGKRFRENSKLKNHTLIHTGEKPFPCHTCGKRFRVNSQLKRHMMIHTGEKPYSCDTCGKKFTQASILSGHLKIHTDEKPYLCSTCGKRFYRMTHLKTHMLIHGPFTHMDSKT